MKIPRNVSAADLIKTLATFGYTVTRQKGSHIRMTSHKSGISHHLTIPNHDPIKIGTLSAIVNEIAAVYNISRTEVIESLFTE